MPKSFRAFLTEKVEDVQWLEKVWIHAKRGDLPLSNSMFKRIMGKNFGKRVVCFHVSSVDNALRLVKAQGTKQSISVSHLIEPSLMNNGMWSGTGVLTKLEGTLLISNMTDIVTRPDTNGIRWVELRILGQIWDPSDEDADDFDALVQDYHKIAREAAALFEKDDIYKTEGQVQYKRVKKFFDDVEVLLKKYPKVLERLLFQIPVSEFVGKVRPHNRHTYAESVVNEIKVLKFGVCSPNLYDQLKYALDKIGSKIPVILTDESWPSTGRDDIETESWKEFGKV